MVYCDLFTTPPCNLSRVVAVDWSLRLGDQSTCTNMALSQVEFGEEIQSRCFHFEKGFTFVNHGSFGVVPTPIREKQKQ